MKNKKNSSQRRAIPKTLSESVYNYLKESIVNNKFKARQKIDEREIADLFEVSRTPVREAIAKLAAEGFLEIDSHKGVLVKEISLKEIKEITQVIGMLDGFAMDQLDFNNINAVELDRLEKMTIKLKQYINQQELIKYIHLNFSLHEKIWCNVNNGFLCEILLHCLTQINRYILTLARIFQDSELGITAKAFKDHKGILEALRNKDKKKLRNIAREHWTPTVPWSRIEEMSQNP